MSMSMARMVVPMSSVMKPQKMNACITPPTRSRLNCFSFEPTIFAARTIRPERSSSLSNQSSSPSA